VESNHTPLANGAHPEGALKILVVDDEPTNRMVLNAMLGKEGHEVVMAGNGQEAIEAFERERPDMVLMDVMMPVMDGYEATRVIKARAGDRFVPIFFLTAVTDEKALARCIEYGGDDFLTKPYNRVILNAKINALARVRRLYTTLKAQKDELAYHQMRVEQEHAVAEKVFANIIRPSSLSVPNLKYLLSPVAIFNGDLLLAAPKPAGGQHVMVGDFTGHGLPAAIGAMPVAEIFYNLTENGFSISDIVAEINQKLNAILPTGLFFAACFIDLDVARNKLAVWNGGLPDVLVYAGQGSIKKRFPSRHLPLGVVKNDELERELQMSELDTGDRVYIYSDGVIEADNLDGKMFGQDRLEECFVANQDPERLFDEIQERLHGFRDGGTQSDDTTLIEIKCDAELLTDFGVGYGEASAAAASHWQLVMELGADAIRNVDPLPSLIHALLEIQGLHKHRGRLFTILAELYANALEHGVLGLDSRMKGSPEGFAEYYLARHRAIESLESGWLRISLAHTPLESGGRLTLRVEDSGPGFDFSKYETTNADQNMYSGRGIGLVRSLCQELSYLGDGNGVEAVYTW